MIYTVALIYIAVIVYLEISHSRERKEWYMQKPKNDGKASACKHFSPHRKAIERIRKNSE